MYVAKSFWYAGYFNHLIYKQIYDNTLGSKGIKLMKLNYTLKFTHQSMTQENNMPHSIINCHQSLNCLLHHCKDAPFTLGLECPVPNNTPN